MPPSDATVSARSLPLRLVVPFTITACVKFEMPALAGVSQREPIRTSKATATTGATGFSRTTTVKPLSSRAERTASAGSLGPRRPRHAQRRGEQHAEQCGAGPTHLRARRQQAHARVVVVAEVLAGGGLDLGGADLAQARQIRSSSASVHVVSAWP